MKILGLLPSKEFDNVKRMILCKQLRHNWFIVTWLNYVPTISSLLLSLLQFLSLGYFLALEQPASE